MKFRHYQTSIKAIGFSGNKFYSGKLNYNNFTNRYINSTAIFGSENYRREIALKNTASKYNKKKFKFTNIENINIKNININLDNITGNSEKEVRDREITSTTQYVDQSISKRKLTDTENSDKKTYDQQAKSEQIIDQQPKIEQKVIKLLYYILTVAGTIATGGIVTLWTYFREDRKKELEKLFDKLKEYSENCSTSSIVLEDQQDNNRFFKRAEELIEKIYTNDKTLSGILVNYSLWVDNSKDFLLKEKGNEALLYLVYLTNCVANYYILEKHNGLRARLLLEKSKNIIPKFLISEGHILADSTFDELQKEKQLKILKETNLAEVYTITIYLLGRSYINYNRSEGKKYFELSKYFGEELHILEAMLSVRSGLCSIMDQEISNSLENPQNVENTKKLLTDIVEIYTKLKNDDSKYIDKYKPTKKVGEQKYIVPSHDTRHKIECSQQLVKYYNRLIEISTSFAEKEKYIDAISGILCGDANNKEPLLTVLYNHKQINNRKFASIYYTVANLLITLQKTTIQHKKIIKDLLEEADLKQNVPLESVEKINYFESMVLTYKLFEEEITHISKINEDNNFTLSNLRSLYHSVMKCKKVQKNIIKNLREELSAEHTDLTNKEIIYMMLRTANIKDDNFAKIITSEHIWNKYDDAFNNKIIEEMFAHFEGKNFVILRSPNKFWIGIDIELINKSEYWIEIDTDWVQSGIEKNILEDSKELNIKYISSKENELFDLFKQQFSEQITTKYSSIAKMEKTISLKEELEAKEYNWGLEITNLVTYLIDDSEQVCPTDEDIIAVG